MPPKPILVPGLCECGCGEPALKRFANGHRSNCGPVAFWARIPEHLGPEPCWEWPGPIYSHFGYGMWGSVASSRWGGLAHRLVYEELVGPIPEGLCVLHRCDNPPCVNPAHLFLGTKKDNMDDMKRKGRGVRSRTTLTKDDVVEIRRLHDAGADSQRGLARRFGVSHQQIHMIVARKAWALDGSYQ